MRSAAQPPCGPATSTSPGRPPGRIEVLVAEALDRLSRDQEISRLLQATCFAGVRLVTLSEGEIGELHVGFKGTMNALFLKDLAHKTRRGLQGVFVRANQEAVSASVVTWCARWTSSGEPCTANAASMKVKRQLSAASSRSSPKVAHPGRSPSPSTKQASPVPAAGVGDPSTIYGNWRRGTGILNNELYIGRLVGNRQRFIKDPATGRRQARLNPEAKWIIEECVCICRHQLGDDLWSWRSGSETSRLRVMTEDKGVRSERARRPNYLLSGLLKCGTCGGGFSKISQSHYGCSTARNKGTCDNLLADPPRQARSHGVGRAQASADAPGPRWGLRRRIPQRSELAKGRTRRAPRPRTARDPEKTEREIRKIDRSHQGGCSRCRCQGRDDGPGGQAIGKLGRLFKAAPPSMPRLHPNLADLYRQKVTNLARSLE